jgi:hypothetical protein
MTTPDTPEVVPATSKPKPTDQPVDLKTADAKTVLAFHRNDDADSRPEAHHHTLGKGRSQASEGGHNHDGTTSVALLAGYTISGNRNTNPGDVIKQMLTALSSLGIIDSTSP